MDEKSASRTLSVVGRTDNPLGTVSFRPLAFPATIRMSFHLPRSLVAAKISDLLYM